MNYEQKYKETLSRAKKLYGKFCVNNVLESLFPELKESEDGRVKKELMEFLVGKRIISNDLEGINIDKTLAWLKKQNEHKDYYTKQELIDMGFSFTLNGDIVTPNEMVADIKKYLAYKKTIEQKPIIDIDGILTANNFDKMFQNCNVHKFNVGDWITHNTAKFIFKIINVGFNGYEVVNRENYKKTISFNNEDNFHLWTIEDAKDGDVLVASDGSLFIFAKVKDNSAYYHFSLCKNGSKEISDGKHSWETAKCCHPATKEQHDFLFEKMYEAGYEWDETKKKLKRIEEEYDGEDYGIDSLFHTQRILEKTLGKVDGYQTDDGILSHKCAITAVKKLYAQKPTEWSEEDEDNLNMAIYFMRSENTPYSPTDVEPVVEWLCGLKQRMKEK